MCRAICRQDETAWGGSSGRSSDWKHSWKRGCQMYLEISTLWSKIACISLSAVSCSMHTLATSLALYKMLAWGPWCAKVAQFLVKRVMQACYPSNSYHFPFCRLVSQYPCVPHLWHPDHLHCLLSSQAAGWRALPKKTIVKQEDSSRSRRDKVCPHLAITGDFQLWLEKSRFAS